MPIDRTQVEKATPARSLYAQTLEFLGKNRGNAYTAHEIADALRLMPTGETGNAWAELLTAVEAQALVFATLDRLLQDGKVKAGLVGKIIQFTAA